VRIIVANLRVWVVTPELHRRGGTERCLAEQVERWRDRFAIRLYTMRLEDVDTDGIEVRRIPELRGPHLLRYSWWFVANQVLRARDVLSAPRPDVIHSPGVNCLDSSAVCVHIIFGKYWDRMRVRAMKDLFSPKTAARALHRIAYWQLVRALESFLYSGGSTLWALSQVDARELERRFCRPAGTISAIHHGVDDVSFSPEATAARRDTLRGRFGVEGRRVLLLVANDAHNKGVDRAIEAVAMLPAETVLAIAGFVDSGHVERLATLSQVAERVRVWPHISEMIDYYAAADILVAPSRGDAFSLPPLEAMACGVPVVISSRAGGICELLEHERNSLIIEDPEDSVELAGHVRRLLEDQGLAQHLSLQGRKLAEQCSWDGNAARTADLIEHEARTPRLLVLSPHPAGTGGIERVTRTLIKSLADCYGPERVGLLPLWDSRGAERLSCRVLRRAPAAPRTKRVAPIERFAYVIAALGSTWRWRNRLIIVCCHAHMAPVAWLCSKLVRSPFVVWCHGREVWGSLRMLVRFSLRHADVVFAGSRFTARAVEDGASLNSGSVRVIPYSVGLELDDEERELPAAPAVGLRALSVARLESNEQYKGVDTLIQAWPKVARRLPEAQLMVVGDGPDRPRLERIASTLGVSDRVSFLGRVSDKDLRWAYALAGVFVLPGRCRLRPEPEGEGFGLVFAEAGLQGLAAVAGDAGGTPEVVTDGETGILVDPDDPDQVAEATVRVLSDKRLARRLGQAGRARALDEFSYEDFRDAVADMVTSLFEVRARTR
jgi:phosphatidylinositol alpha-1,6-mannosyltransferase